MMVYVKSHVPRRSRSRLTLTGSVVLVVVLVLVLVVVVLLVLVVVVVIDDRQIGNGSCLHDRTSCWARSRTWSIASNRARPQSVETRFLSARTAMGLVAFRVRTAFLTRLIAFLGSRSTDACAINRSASAYRRSIAVGMNTHEGICRPSSFKVHLTDSTPASA